MASRKQRITIEINGGAPKSRKIYSFGYAQTKGIVLRLSAAAATIEMTMTTSKDAKSFGSNENPHYTNALHKTMIAWLLVYGRFVPIKHITLSISNDKQTVYPSSDNMTPPTLPSVDFAKRIKMDPNWRNPEIISSVLSIPKSRAGSRTAAVAALAIAKTKTTSTSIVCQSERFIYLWMAMNGYYNSLKRLALPLVTNKKKVKQLKRSEAEAIKLCLEFHEMGDCSINRTDAPEIARLAILALEGITNVDQDLSDQSTEKLKNFEAELRGFQGADANNPNPYTGMTLAGYLTFCLPYYFRCSFIHADRPFPVFVQKSDERYWVLALLSDILERFLDANLWHLFDEKWIREWALPRLYTLVSN